MNAIRLAMILSVAVILTVTTNAQDKVCALGHCMGDALAEPDGEKDGYQYKAFEHPLFDSAEVRATPNAGICSLHMRDDLDDPNTTDKEGRILLQYKIWVGRFEEKYGAPGRDSAEGATSLSQTRTGTASASWQTPYSQEAIDYANAKFEEQTGRKSLPFDVNANANPNLPYTIIVMTDANGVKVTYRFDNSDKTLNGCVLEAEERKQAMMHDL